MDEVARRLQAAIEERRSDQRLERVGEDRRAHRSAAARFAFAESDRIGQAELQRGAEQAVLADEVGANARQVALVRIAQPLEQEARNDQAQDGVAEEFEALVVVGAEAAVREGPFEQRRIAEAVADALLQGVEAGIHAGRTAPIGKAGRKTSVDATLELDKKVDGLHEFHFLVVGERDDDLFVFLGDRSDPCR